MLMPGDVSWEFTIQVHTTVCDQNALSYYQRGLEICQHIDGHSLAAANTHNNIGLVLLSLERYEEGSAQFGFAVSISKSLLKEKETANNADFASNLATYTDNLGMAQFHLGQYDHAHKLWRYALSTRMSLHGETHPSTQISLRHVRSVEPLLSQAVPHSSPALVTG
eukprot:gene10328-9116_t